MNQILLRPATVYDAPSMLAIYGPFVTDTTVTAEYDVPSASEFTGRIERFTKKTPWLICEIQGKVAGYAYAAPHRERAAYQWSVETSIYVDPAYHRMGIATALYSALFELLYLQGYYSIYVGITSPNPKSISFHQSMGFEYSGTYRKSMYKFGEWRDVTWMGKSLREHSGEPSKTLLYSEIEDTDEFSKILRKTEKRINMK